MVEGLIIIVDKCETLIVELEDVCVKPLEKKVI